MKSEFGLKRVLGLPELVGIEVGTTVGAGIFSLTALAVKFTGPSVPLAFAAAAVPIAFIMMTVAMLGSVMPVAGGTYRYPSRLFSPLWAMLGVWCYALGLVLGALPMYATECVYYLKALWPGLPPRTSAVFLLTFFFLLNLFGVSLAAWVQAVMTAVLIFALVLFGLAGLPGVEFNDFVPPFPGGAGGFVLAACILTFALQGANSVIELGAEIKRPGRNIPLSLAISLPLVAVLYVLVATTAVGNIDLGTWLANEHPNLTQPAKNFLSPPLFLFFMVGGAVFAFTTTLNGTFIWATKSLLVVAKDRLLPEALARTSRYGTPALFLALVWALAVVAVILDLGIRVFASYATIGGMIIFIPCMAAAMRLPRKAPGLYAKAGFKLKGKMLYFAPGAGIAASALLILILVADLGWKALPLAGWLAAGYGFYLWRKPAVERQAGKSFRRLMEDDLAELERAAAEEEKAGQQKRG